MALPPTLIYEYLGDSPQETYENLKKAGLLSIRGRWFKEKVLALINETINAYRAQDKGITGPNEDDHIVAALRNSGYLSWKGTRYANKDQRDIPGYI
jgi:hypothetical protein